MSTTEPSPTSRVKLYYYFWLPAGVDEFELGSDGNRNFENTAKYRIGVEGAIVQRLKKALSDNLSEGFRIDEGVETIRVQDGGLGLRKLEFDFRYQPELDPKIELDERQIYRLTNQLTGRAIILSNGLYLWCFNIDYPSNLALQEILQSTSHFLRTDFVERHIKKLFEFEWGEEDKPLYSRKGKEAYAGALTYYQIDLLFNGVFDKDAHPTNFMETNLESDVPNEAKALYKVGGIIKSLSRFAIGDYHSSLFDDFKDSRPEGSKDSCPAIDSIDFGASRFFVDELSGPACERPAEQVVSRITYAGMEQFLRTAISSSLLHYKAGLDHCRTQLTNDSLLIRINKTAGELRRDSLAHVLSAADLQAYTSIVSGKLPAFHFLHNIIKEIEQATRPTEARNSNRLNDPNGSEWVYGQFMLHDALSHYQLYVKSIENDIAEISRSLDTGRIDEIITELTDTRKLTEIASESANGTIYEGNHRRLDMLIFNLTGLGLIISVILAFLQVYVAFGIWWMDRLFPNGETPTQNDPASTPGIGSPWNIFIAIVFWLAAPILIGIIYKSKILAKLVLRDAGDSKKKQGGRRGESREDSDSPIETHVFDYSFFHEKLAQKQNSAEMIDELARSMPGIELGEEVSRCASRSSFRETPLSAVERTKYTLESRDSRKENGSYTFHIEVDRRMGRAIEYLREVRLVIKKPASRQYSAKGCAQHIIYKCLNYLNFEEQERVIELLDQQFHTGANMGPGRAAVREYEDKTGVFTKKEIDDADKILDELRVPPTGVPFVYDTAALGAAKRGDRTMWAVHRRGLDRVGMAVVPAKVLEQFRRAESQPWLDRLLRGCVIEPFDAPAGGEGTGDVVEAQVVLTALRYEAGVLTSHPDVLQRLAQAKGGQLRLYQVAPPWVVVHLVARAR